MKLSVPAVALALLLSCTALSAQESQAPADSLVRLMSAKSAEMYTEKNRRFRKVTGPARFLHNNTYLLCDTAIWDVDLRIIQAWGNVKIMQDETVLSSQSLDYYIDDDMARFRGGVVQLEDKDGNILRTGNLDYNTKDSVATFYYGGSMRDKDGQIIESENGSYDSKIKLFTFDKDVNMYTDSVFVKTGRLEYHASEGYADFLDGVDAWKDASMLSSQTGRYISDSTATFHFYDSVHGLTETREAWGDTLHFVRATSDLSMHGNVQLTEEKRRAWVFGEILRYTDSLSLLTLKGNASVIAELKDSTAVKQLDTLYFSSDSLWRQEFRKCDIPGDILSISQKRVTNMAVDPVGSYRKKAEESAKQSEENRKREMEEQSGRKGPATPTAGNLTPGQAGPESPGAPTPPPAEGNSPEEGNPSGENPPAEGSGSEENSSSGEGSETSEAEAEAEAQKDTTLVPFMGGIGNVKLYKSDLQIICGDLRYSELDSLAVLSEVPYVWNEGNRQYAADSIIAYVDGSAMRKASLLSNAFITIQEDTTLFDQIRGAEMMAYFDSTSALERFDVMGGANAIFFLEENETLATVNRVESKMLSAYFKNGQMERVFYFDSPKNDAIPTAQLRGDDRRMKGFKWDPELRPSGREDVTPYNVRPSERAAYESRPQAKFRYTERYFPGHMKRIRSGIAARDSARKASNRLRDSLSLNGPQEAFTTIELPSDTTLINGEVMPLGTPGGAESEGGEAPAGLPAEASAGESVETATEGVPSGASETPAAPSEGTEPGNGTEGSSSEAVEQNEVSSTGPALSEKELEAMRKAAAKDSIKAARDSIRAAKDAAREARWAELDKRDAEKAAKKAERKQERYRKKVLKQLKIRDKNLAREERIRARYIERYRKQKEREDARAAAKAERDAARAAAKEAAAVEKAAAKAEREAEKEAAEAENLRQKAKIESVKDERVSSPEAPANLQEQ